MPGLSPALLSASLSAAILLAAPAAPLAAQALSLWSRTWNLDEKGAFIAAAPASDGGAVLGGFFPSSRFSEASPGDRPDALVMRIDNEGAALWQTLLGGSSDDATQAVAQTPDGGYLAAGRSRSGDGDFPWARGGRRHSLWAAKLDASGGVVWIRELPGPEGNLNFEGKRSRIGAIAADGEGGAVAVGIGLHFTSGDGCGGDSDSGTELALWRISADGNKVTLSCPGIPVAIEHFIFGAAVMPDGGAVATCGSRNPDVVARLTPSGRKAWVKDMQAWFLTALAPAADGGIFGAGTISGDRPGIFKMDPDGGLLWDKPVSGVAEGLITAIAAREDGLFGAGLSDKPGTGDTDMLAFRSDSEGGTVWNTTAGGSGRDIAAAAAALSDGSFLAAGSTTSRDGFLANRTRKGLPGDHIAPWTVRFAR